MSPKPIRAVSPGLVPACPSPTFQRIQRDFSPRRPASPRREHVSLRVVQTPRAPSPVITLTNHGIPPWGFGPSRRQQARSPSPAAGLVALQPPSEAPKQPQRAQSPSFNELERQMVQKNAYPLNSRQNQNQNQNGGLQLRRAASPTVREFHRELARSPTVTLAQHRSASPSVRSRPQERRIVRLSSPVPFKKEGSPFRHVVVPSTCGSGYSAPAHNMVRHVVPNPFLIGISLFL